MQEVSRRTFFKSATVAGAALALGSAAAGCTKKDPNVVDPTDSTDGHSMEVNPPKWDYYTANCHGCITCCPVKVYVDEEGVVRKIEGHPYGDINLGSLCVKGMNQIHTAYSPLHVIYPLRRTGARGAANMAFERISWQEAIDEASDKIVDILQKYGTYSILATTGGGGAYVGASLPPEMSASLFSTNAYEPGAAQCFLPRMAVASYMGMPGQSMADGMVVEPFKGFGSVEKEYGIKNDTEAIVLWGTQPSCSQTARAGRGMAELRAKGCKTVVVDPHFSTDAAKATVHLALRPGSDCALLLSWFRYIFANKLYDEEFCKYYTNLPHLINPDTKLAYKAQELFPDYVQTTPENTPVYVGVDEATGEIRPLPFGTPENVSKEINPAIFATVTVNGKECKTAGQIYKEEAEPWTLERAEEFCWVPAAKNEAAIKIYTDPLKEGKCAGITHGVATDMMEISSQAPLGTMGLDAIMGYVNKPGCTETSGGGMAALFGGGAPLTATNQWGKCAPDGSVTRPTSSYSGDYQYGYVIGATEAENLARVAAVDQNAHAVYAKLVRDRLGLTNHRGLTAWNQSHIPAVRQAVETGEPWRPRVWMEHSGNKFCCVGSAGAWFNASISNMDFVTHQYANFTSFDAELTDIFFPTEEWLEMSNASGMGSSTKTFASAPIIHLGETVNPIRPYNRLLSAVYEKANKVKDKIVFTGTGQTIEELGLEFPFVSVSMGFPGMAAAEDSTNDDMSELQSQIQSMAAALGLAGAADAASGMPDMSGAPADVDTSAAPAGDLPADASGAPDAAAAGDASGMPDMAAMMGMGAALNITEEEYLAAVRNNPRAFSTSDPTETWTYGQHLVLANDGLPKGFATESRKVEVYCELLLKISRTGFPYNWPEPFDEPVDSRIGCYDGEYSPICRVALQKEAPYVENSEGYIMDFDPDFPLALTEGRRVFFHHGTMRHAPFSRELYPVPFVSINPKTAAEYGISDGDWVEISSRRTEGEEYDINNRGTERAYAHVKDHATKTGDPIRTIAYVTEMVGPNVLWMERYWNPECFDKSQTTKSGGWKEMSMNVLTNAVDGNFNEAFGSYTNRGIAVNIKKSTRPERVWVTPEEFQPFMPTEENQTTAGIGVLRDNKAVHNHFTDFDY